MPLFFLYVGKTLYIHWHCSSSSLSVSVRSLCLKMESVQQKYHLCLLRFCILRESKWRLQHASDVMRLRNQRSLLVFHPPPLTQVLGTFYQELAGRSVLTSALVHLFTFGMHVEEAELC